jgi:hypothetical protein
MQLANELGSYLVYLYCLDTVLFHPFQSALVTCYRSLSSKGCMYS